MTYPKKQAALRMTNDNSLSHTELIWQGKFDGDLKLPPKRLVDKTTLPFQTIELISEPRKAVGEELSLFGDQKKEGWTNKLVWGDNKFVLTSLLKDYAGKINLFYIDPPFDVGADFSVQVQVGDEEITKEPSVLEMKAYRDTWGKGTDSYLQMLYERLLLMRELLADNGSIYVHLDWHVGHYVKVMMDEIFGKENFRNEIIWHYDQGARPKTSFGKKHDAIFWYSKSDNYVFNSDNILVPFESGMTEWRYTKGGQKGKEMPEGKIPSDVWDIKLNAMALEHLGFATQKPEKLLERIVLASSKEGDLVVDFFCGSGTTGVVAEKLGRRWLMCDLGRFAIHTSRKRLMEVQRQLKAEGKPYFPFEIQNLGKYERQLWQLDSKIANYIKFIVELYKGEPLTGFTNLHGKKEGRLIHIGAVDSPVTTEEVKEAIEECLGNRFNALDVLGWEWEMSVNEEAVEAAKQRGVKLRLFQIPREVMEKQAIEQGDVKFFELDYMGVDVKTDKSRTTVKLTNFAIPSDDLIPDELREKITSWSDYIDYWSVDWNYESLKSPDGNPIFENNWQSFRSKKNPKLELETTHTYDKPGKHTIAIKAIDIFGNDTSKTVEVNIK